MILKKVLLDESGESDNVKSNHYIDNEKFSKELLEWKIKCQENKALDLPRPKMNDYLGDCLIKMAHGLSRRNNFMNYTYKDEMIGDAIETVLKYGHNFDPEALNKKGKKGDAFSYVDFIMSRAFTNRLKIEKNEHHIKLKSLKQLLETDGGIFEDDDFHDAFGTQNKTETSAIVTDMLAKCETYERELEEKRNKIKKKQVDEVKKDSSHILYDIMSLGDE